MTPNSKAEIAAAFDAAADHFDDPALSFRRYFGEQTVARAQLRPAEVVLDVCSGSGNSAFPAALAVGPSGRVIALDLAPGLIALGRARAAAQSLAHLEFRHADFDQAYFRNASFDAVVCVFGLHYFPDPSATLNKMWRILRPGGRLAVTTWGPGRLEPLHSVFWNTLGDLRPELLPSTDRAAALNTPDLLRGAFERAAIPAPAIEAEHRDHPIRAAEDWWNLMLGSGYRPVINRLTDAERGHVRAACLAIAAPTLAAPVLYTMAVK